MSKMLFIILVCMQAKETKKWKRQTCTMSQFYISSVHVIVEQMDEEINLVWIYLGKDKYLRAEKCTYLKN
jgi:hypothetical protein